ncbi:HPP family protein [Euzebya sp.]|uniref:HPP family protein n=1 Tax=Euzebya sp. TaxID=1971409 RepID=UPI003512BD79
MAISDERDMPPPPLGYAQVHRHPPPPGLGFPGPPPEIPEVPVGLLARARGGRGEGPARRPVSEVVWSWLGAALGIYAIVWPSTQMLPGTESVFLIGSFGASAVLVYGVPFADLAQPRNVLGGHVVSAAVGVTVQHLVGDLALASAIAVATAIAAMHVTRTIHPPGGATALIAVIGGMGITDLGYTYVVAPVGVSAVAMLAIGIVVNNLSRNPARHYPKYWW